MGNAAGGTTLNNLGALAYSLGQGRGAEYYEQALVILREVGNRSGEGTTLNNLGSWPDLGSQTGAEYFEQALVILREVGNRSGKARRSTTWDLADGWAEEQARTTTSRRSHLREVGNRSGEGTMLNNLGELAKPGAARTGAGLLRAGASHRARWATAVWKGRRSTTWAAGR